MGKHNGNPDLVCKNNFFLTRGADNLCNHQRVTATGAPVTLSLI